MFDVDFCQTVVHDGARSDRIVVRPAERTEERTWVYRGRSLRRSPQSCCAFAGRAPPGHRRPPRAISRRSRSTTTRRTRWSSTSLNDGRVFYIERDGRLMIWKPNTQQTVTAGTVPVTRSQENGLLGLQLAPDFDTSNWVYLFYSQLPDSIEHPGRLALQGQRRHARPGLRAEILTFQHQTRPSAATPPARCTSAPTAASTSPPATTRTRSTRPASTRSTSAPAATLWDAQRTVGQHERPQRQDPADQAAGEPDRHARRRHDVHGPARQPVRRGPGHDNKTRPEIFGMGFRNPFRFTVDPETGWVLGARLRPRRQHDQRQPRPAGLGRVQRDHEAPATTAGPTASATTRRTTTTTSRPRRPAPSSTAPRRSTTRPTTRA